MKRKLCVATGSRADYGLLKPLLAEICADTELILQLIATGSHLSAEFGLTYQEIEKDGFVVDEKIEILNDSDSPAAISRSMGLAMEGFGKAYERLKPDLLVILGDRFEIFCAAASALVSRIPVAHISGGEVTEGVFDDSFRHSITKMSHLHFVATEEYKKRVIQLGENPKKVFNVGEIGLADIKRTHFLSRETLERELGFTFNKHNLLVTFHPATLENNTSIGQFKTLLDVLDSLDETMFIFTKANADTGGRAINKAIDEYVSKNKRKAAAFTSLGRLRYLSIMQFVDGLVGNSSSGLVEAPSFKIGAVNIGDRQKGRIKAKSVIDCEPSKDSILKAIEELYSSQFQTKLKNLKNPYGDGKGVKKVKNILKQCNLDNIMKKSFYDVRFTV